jgi:hypothetical protein
MAGETAIRTQTDILIEQGEPKAALKLLERARREALSRKDVTSLEALLAAARAIEAQLEGRRHDEAARITYAALQNIRFVSRIKEAEEEERQRFTRPSVESVNPSAGRLLRALAVWLAMWPAVAFVYPFFAAASGGQTLQGLIVFATVLAAFWLLPLGLLCFWWRRGDRDLIYPLIGWFLLPIMLAVLFIPFLWRSVRQELALVPRDRRRRKSLR